MATTTATIGTIGELKKIRKPLFIRCPWSVNDDEYFPISKAAFLRTIGADVPHADDGLSDNTEIKAIETDDSVLIG